MNERFLVVVGDKFGGFTLDKDAITLSQLRGVLGLPSGMLAAHERLVLVPGQGLGDGDMSEIVGLAEKSAHKSLLDLGLWRDAPGRAAPSRSHKHLARNTLISEPRRLAEDEFEMDLLIDEGCELMGDHQTGQHLQGMLLVEAARQSFLVVSEAFFVPRDGEKYYFVFDDLSARYKRFVFPVGAKLVYSIREKEITASRQRFVVDVAVEQCGVETATISGTFTVVKDARITRMETGMAKDVLASFVADIAKAQAVAPVSPDLAEAA